MNRSIRTARTVVMFALLVFAFWLGIVLNVNTGSLHIPQSEIAKIILSGGRDQSREANVIWKLRLPRLLAAAVLGGALGVSGYLLQNFFRNPIAGPYVLGISNGAKLLVGFAMIFVLRRYSGVPFWVIMASAFLGSMLVTGFVLLFARRVKSMTALLVIGIMIGSVCTAATDFLVQFADDANVANLHDWSMGSFSAVSWKNLHVASAVILLSVAGSFMLVKPISAYQLGEAYAQSMGVNVKRFRVLLISLSSLLSASVTALSGPISFVGVAVPHLTKLLFGTARPQIVIPGSFLLGGAFCMYSDLLARTLFSPSEIAISTVTALFGAPVVIALMLKRQRRREIDS